MPARPEFGPDQLIIRPIGRQLTCNCGGIAGRSLLVRGRYFARERFSAKTRMRGDRFMRVDPPTYASETPLCGAFPLVGQLPSRALAAHGGERDGHLGECARIECGAGGAAGMSFMLITAWVSQCSFGAARGNGQAPDHLPRSCAWRVFLFRCRRTRDDCRLRHCG
jgi:hypothetical protein